MHDFELKKRRILDRVDIVDLVSEHVTLKRSGRRLVGLCPFHAEKTPSFTVSADYGSFKCFGCGKSGDVFSFIQFRENVDFSDAMALLADRAGVDLSAGRQNASPSSGASRADLIKINTWAARYFRSRLTDETIGRSARAYLRERDTSETTEERFELGLAIEGGQSLAEAAARAGFDQRQLIAADLMRQGDRGRAYETFRHRLMFPIRDASHRVIGFGGRTLVDDRAKYLNTSQNALFDKGRQLYGVHLAREAISQRSRAVVVEGYTDCLAAHQAGVTETVAALGTALTAAHVDLLRRYSDQVILLFDSDDAGEAAAERAIRVALPRCVTVRMARIPDGTDPSEFLGRSGVDEFSDVLNHAVDALEFKWQLTRERFCGDGSDIRRREAVLDFLRVVAEAADAHAVDAIQRGLLVNQVAHLLRMGRGEVDNLMVRLRPRHRERATSTPTGSTRPATRGNEEQAAWTHVLEVLLNEPGLWSCDDLTLEADCVTDPRDRRIAAAVFDLVERVGEFHVTEVTARFQDSEDVARVLSLAQTGAGRGNYENTYRLACERIRVSRAYADMDRGKAKYFSDRASGASLEQSTEQIGGIGDGVRAHRHYVPRRLSRHAVEGVEAAEL